MHANINSPWCACARISVVLANADKVCACVCVWVCAWIWFLSFHKCITNRAHDEPFDYRFCSAAYTSAVLCSFCSNNISAFFSSFFAMRQCQMFGVKRTCACILALCRMTVTPSACCCTQNVVARLLIHDLDAKEFQFRRQNVWTFVRPISNRFKRICENHWISKWFFSIFVFLISANDSCFRFSRIETKYRMNHVINFICWQTKYR